MRRHVSDAHTLPRMTRSRRAESAGGWLLLPRLCASTVAGEGGPWGVVVRKLLDVTGETSCAEGHTTVDHESGRATMHTGIGISDYLSMIAIVAILVSLWMH